MSHSNYRHYQQHCSTKWMEREYEERGVRGKRNEQSGKKVRGEGICSG